MPRNIKSTQELTNRSFLDKLIGDERAQEGVQESLSPLDFLPYEKIASSGINTLKGAAKFNNLKNMLKGDTMMNEVFNPNDESHIKAIRPYLEKYLPHTMDNDFSNGELVTDLLKDPNRQIDLIKMPEVQRAISDTGMQSPKYNLSDVVSSDLNNNRPITQMRSNILNHIQGNIDPVKDPAHQSHIENLLKNINVSSTEPVAVTGPINGTPQSLDQAIGNAINTNDPMHVKDYLSQKFTASEFSKPEDMGSDILDLFNKINSK